MARLREKTVWAELPRYPVQATGFTVTASSYPQLLQRISEHCHSNQIETPSEAEVEQFLCDNLCVRCIDENGKPFENQYVSRSNWPLLVRPMKLLLREGDAGLGDVIHRTIGDERSEAFKTWYLATFGKPCDCDGRRQRLNREYPA